MSFEKIEDEGVARYFNELPTSFALPDKAVDCLMSVGADILFGSGVYQDLVEAHSGVANRVEGPIHVSSCR